MTNRLSELELWKLPRSQSLPVIESRVPYICAICGVGKDADSWCVRLPDTTRKACPNCAQDRGFTVT